MWDLPGPGLEPVSPVLAGGFLTTAPPGKPDILLFDHLKQFCSWFCWTGYRSQGDTLSLSAETLWLYFFYLAMILNLY